jgi:DNA-binding response OmpR family regulator
MTDVITGLSAIRSERRRVRPCIILIVVPEEDLRRSIVFALEAEGLDVVTCARLEDLLSLPRLALADCMIVDDKAFRISNGCGGLAQLAMPVVLLADTVPDTCPAWVDAVLMKPLLGRSLVDAVVAQLARHHLALPDIAESPSVSGPK